MYTNNNYQCSGYYYVNNRIYFTDLTGILFVLPVSFMESTRPLYYFRKLLFRSINYQILISGNSTCNYTQSTVLLKATRVCTNNDNIIIRIQYETISLTVYTAVIAHFVYLIRNLASGSSPVDTIICCENYTFHCLESYYFLQI